MFNNTQQNMYKFKKKKLASSLIISIIALISQRELSRD